MKYSSDGYFGINVMINNRLMKLVTKAHNLSTFYRANPDDVSKIRK